MDKKHEPTHMERCLDLMRSQDISDWHKPYAVTLRFKKGTTRDDALSNLIYFSKRLNKKIFKNAYTRHGKKLRNMSKVEWGWEEVQKEQSHKDPHIHMIIESPEHLPEEDFHLLVRQQWEDTERGMVTLFYDLNRNKPRDRDTPRHWVVFDFFNMDKMYSDGWQNYISKKRTTSSGDDVLFEAWVV